MRDSMRAAVIAAPRTCELRVVERPEPGPRQILVQVEGCGVCGSNLPRWEGRSWFRYPADPGSPGHEGWGRVVARGAEVQRPAVGDRVAFLSERAFAEYDVADAESALVLPPTLDGEAVPGEALGCAMNIWRRCAVLPGQRVAIIGLGFLGALLTQIAARAGAQVYGLSQREFSRALGRELGAIDTVDLSDSDDAIVEQIAALTGNELCDCVIEVVGLSRPLDLAAKLCCERGRLVIAGFHQDGPRQVDMFLWNWRGLDVINAHERAATTYVAGMAEAVRGLVAGQLEPSRLYTHRVPLERIGDAFEALRTRPHGFIKALVMP